MIYQSKNAAALVTGGSSGIGRDIAICLSRMGYEVIIAARNEERLNETKSLLSGKAHVVVTDLNDRNSCFELYKKANKIGNIEILINNAGFGLFGEFSKSDLNTELSMIETNITALHILTKLFVKDFISRNNGYILNIASSAGFMPGPLMATYYSTKAYVLRLSQAISRELKNSGSNVYIGALCPGPVDTNFNNTANVRFSLKGLKSMEVAEYAVKNMFKRKTVIIPGTAMKLSKFGLRLLPDNIITKVAYNIQHRKG